MNYRQLKQLFKLTLRFKYQSLRIMKRNQSDYLFESKKKQDAYRKQRTGTYAENVLHFQKLYDERSLELNILKQAIRNLKNNKQAFSKIIFNDESYIEQTGNNEFVYVGKTANSFLCKIIRSKDYDIESYFAGLLFKYEGDLL
jgi:hypothetical protein